MNLRIVSVVVLAALFGASVAMAAPKAVIESARKIPVAYTVDVVVVGGTTAGVEAAVAAAKGGASVFLAAPRTYLGEDMCATLRLWLDEGERAETELGRRIFAPRPAAARPVPKGAHFTYTADQPSAPLHRDTKPPGKLTDGLYGSAAKQSVQYDKDTNIVADLGKVQTLESVSVLVYQRTGVFEVQRVGIETSADGEAWAKAATIDNKQLDDGGAEQAAIELTAAVTGRARYVRFAVKKTERSERMLLAEIVIETAEQADAKPAPPAPKLPPMTTPMQVKRTLDDALLAAGVKFLFGSYATEVLRDGSGRPAGIVMANRAGRQAVIAKVVIDATDRAIVARLAGATCRRWPGGKQTFTRVVIGGDVRTGKGLTGRKVGRTFPLISRGRGGTQHRPTGRQGEIIEYTLTLPVPDATFASFAAAEQLARDMTFTPGLLRASEVLFQVPPDPVNGQKPLVGDWPGAGKVDLGAFRPAGVERMYVLSGCADVPRGVAEKLLRPTGLTGVGKRIGQTAAKEAEKIAKPQAVSLPGGKVVSAAAEGEVRELLTGVRANQVLPKVPSASRPLPVIGTYDVVVIGGGTSGAPAGIGAARKGAKTLVVEYLHGLGGVGTTGLIAGYYHGYHGGFTAEVDRGVAAVGGQKKAAKRWNVQWKMQWWRSALRESKADVWFGGLGCGAFVKDGQVRGAVVATPLGRGVVLADVVIDSTGNADVAAAAGAPCIHTDGAFLAVQGTGLPPHALGASYTNTDYTFVDETDMLDVWRMFVGARKKFGGAFDLGQLIDTRERRRIRGEIVMTIVDQVNGRTYGDIVGMCKSDFDTHGYTVHPYFVLEHPERKSITTYIPYRCLLPVGLEGILVTGLGISVHRDAIPVVRMQPDVQNVGYAAGVAAAMAAPSGGATREVDLRGLQEHLAEIGCIPKTAVGGKDSYPMGPEKIAEAVGLLAEGGRGTAVVMAHKSEAQPLLREAYQKAKRAGAEADTEEEAEKARKAELNYARVLAVCGDPTGLETLIAAVAAAKKWDAGWNFRGMGQYGSSISPLDRLIIAMGMAGEKRAVPVIVEKAALLDASKEFSHHRAVALALELIGDRSAAPALGELLAKEGMTGHAVLEPAAAGNRTTSLREIIVARALFRLGDHKGLARKSLTNYAKDLRGHFSRHAHAILAAGGDGR